MMNTAIDFSSQHQTRKKPVESKKQQQFEAVQDLIDNLRQEKTTKFGVK